VTNTGLRPYFLYYQPFWLNMRQIKTKINTHFSIIAWKALSFGAVLPFLFSGFVALAADLSPQTVISFTNEERAKKDLPLLVESEALDRAAELKAADMLKNNYFSHTSPAGLTPWHWIKESGYEYQFAGENLAINFTSVSEQGKAWMNSKTHRENILNSDYTEVGVAVVSGTIKGKTSFVTVQLFGKPHAPVATKNTKENSESIFAAVPMVKGVHTENLEAGAVQYATNAMTSFQSFYQQIKATLIQNQASISQTAWELALILIFLSLTAPGIVFVAFSFKEIAPKTHHFSSG
jgi:hypothetical protein